MKYISLFFSAVCFLRGIGATGLDAPFTVEVITAVEKNATECSLVDKMELKLRLASSFQSNSRKFYHTRVQLEEFYAIEGYNDDGGRELLTTRRTSLKTNRGKGSPTRGALRGQSSNERELLLWTWTQLTVKGRYVCRWCPIDNGDRRVLSGPTNFEEYMTKYMTKDLQRYIIRKSVNGTTPSCYGDQESAFVDFALIE